MSHDPDLILGLDGGGTKTLLAVVDRAAAIHHLHRYPSIDPFAHPDWAERMEAIVKAIRAARPRLVGAVLGMPCHGEAERLSHDQRTVAEALLPCPQQVINDVEAAFDGALAGRAGVLLLAGTGSMAWAGNARHSIRCGGWGDIFGDEGSGYWIGRKALSEVAQALDGRSPHEGFARDLLGALGVAPEALVGWCYDLASRRATIAGLAQIVDRQAETGDSTARRILTDAADALAAHADACAGRLDLPRPLTWSHAGSVFRSRTLMRRTVERIGTEPVSPRLPPVGGALLRAARRAGWAVDALWIERLGRALAEQDHGGDAA